MPPSSRTDGQSRREARPGRYLSLFHRVAAINAVLLLVAVGLTILILVPGHESSYRIDEEGVVLVAAVALVVLLNLILLRRAVRPLQRLTTVARAVDLTDPLPPAARRPPAGSWRPRRRSGFGSLASCMIRSARN